jgi:hypothetical protein
VGARLREAGRFALKEKRARKKPDTTCWKARNRKNSSKNAENWIGEFLMRLTHTELLTSNLLFFRTCGEIGEIKRK